jgi:hypothetical protein
MRPVWILALAACGCRGILGIERPVGGIDAAVDAALDDVPGACATWHPLGFDPCALGGLMSALHVTAGQYTYDTTDRGGRLTDGSGRVVVESGVTATPFDGSPVAVLWVTRFTVDAGAAIRVVGRKPLLVVAWETIEVGGSLDAGSNTAPPVRFGAGANEGCGANTGHDGSDPPTTGGSGGGGGGGFQGGGGLGARGGSPTATGGPGGAAAASPLIRGGCPGGASGAAGPIATLPATPASRAQGGAGGGAIRLVSHDAIMVAGSISANGAGGAGAPLNSACGGGGGGAGGYAALEAPSVTISGAITANGGGGGGGGGPNDSGHEGSDGKIDLQAAPGGATSANGCGQPGGAGSVAAQLAGSDAVFAGGCGGGGGGGGGGGAAGFILIASPAYTATATAKISPTVLGP